MAPADLGSKAASGTASLTQISHVSWRFIGCQLAQRSSDIVTLPQSHLVRPISEANKTRVTRAQPKPISFIVQCRCSKDSCDLLDSALIPSRPE